MNKKDLLLASVAVLAMASCTNDETIEMNLGRAIDFRTSVLSRGKATEQADIKDIKVTAFVNANDQPKFFEGIQFNGTDGTDFNSAHSYYWPADGSTLNFVAWAPVSVANPTISDVSDQSLVFTPGASITDQVDFILATGSGNKKRNENDGVNLNFEHMLSQIEIKAVNKNPNYKFEVIGVRIGKVNSSGTLDIDDSKTWKSQASKQNYDITWSSGDAITLEGTAKSIMGSDGNEHGSATNGTAMLIPQQLVAWNSITDYTNSGNNSYLAVKVKITNTTINKKVYPITGDFDWVAVPVDTKWEKGNKYTYTLDFTNGGGKVAPKTDEDQDPLKPGQDVLGAPIKFKVTVTPWVDNKKDVSMK